MFGQRMRSAVFVCSRKCLLTVRFVMKAFSKFHTPACCGFTFSGALAPQPPRQVESRKMQRLLPETAMKELHSQAPGGNEVETIRRHLAFGCFGGVEEVDAFCFCILYRYFLNQLQYTSTYPVCICVFFLGWIHSDLLMIVNIL